MTAVASRSQVAAIGELQLDAHTRTEQCRPLLSATDTRSFELFYRRHFESLLGFFARRIRDPELAADLTAETFAAALSSRRRYRPGKGRADSWPFSIAYHKLADARRRKRRRGTARAGASGWSGSSSPDR